jgi:hypothetical protein
VCKGLRTSLRKISRKSLRKIKQSRVRPACECKAYLRAIL